MAVVLFESSVSLWLIHCFPLLVADFCTGWRGSHIAARKSTISARSVPPIRLESPIELNSMQCKKDRIDVNNQPFSALLSPQSFTPSATTCLLLHNPLEQNRSQILQRLLATPTGTMLRRQMYVGSSNGLTVETHRALRITRLTETIPHCQ